MSKIDDLIARLCPGGVGFQRLGKIVGIFDNMRKPVSKAKRVVGSYPYYGANGIQDWVNSYIFDGTYLLLGEDGSVINSNKTPVMHWVSGKFWANNHAHILGQKSDDALLKFIYYYLQTCDISDVVRGIPPKLSQKNLRNICIPIPPLPIQQEIVKVLDAFTEMDAKLKAELEARKKQYSYYRDQLLSFDKNTKGVSWNKKNKISDMIARLCPGGVGFATLGSIAVRNRGINITASKMKILHKNKAPIRIFAAGNTFADVNYEDVPKQYIIEIPSVIVKSRGNIEFEYYNKQFSHKNEIFSYTIYDKTIDQKFVFYYLSTLTEKLQNLARGKSVKLPQLTISDTNNIEIPIPPLPIQQEIVSILDKFDTLINDLSEGLPAEILARRKQYEHYRDKLLTFKEVT